MAAKYQKGDRIYLKEGVRLGLCKTRRVGCYLKPGYTVPGLPDKTGIKSVIVLDNVEDGWGANKRWLLIKSGDNPPGWIHSQRFADHIMWNKEDIEEKQEAYLEKNLVKPLNETRLYSIKAKDILENGTYDFHKDKFDDITLKTLKGMGIEQQGKEWTFTQNREERETVRKASYGTVQRLWNIYRGTNLP